MQAEGEPYQSASQKPPQSSPVRPESPVKPLSQAILEYVFKYSTTAPNFARGSCIFYQKYRSMAETAPVHWLKTAQCPKAAGGANCIRPFHNIAPALREECRGGDCQKTSQKMSGTEQRGVCAGGKKPTARSINRILKLFESFKIRTAGRKYFFDTLVYASLIS